MAGFSPVGSQPVASTPNVETGQEFGPAGAATFIFEVPAGSAPTVEGVNAVRVWQLAREVLRSASTGTTEILVRVMVRETLRSTALASGRRRMSLM